MTSAPSTGQRSIGDVVNSDDDLPPRLVIKLRIDESQGTAEVLGLGLDRGRVNHPGNDAESRFRYAATREDGSIVSEGRFDFLRHAGSPGYGLPARTRTPDVPSVRSQATVTPDDVVHLGHGFLLINLPYRVEIAAVRIFRMLTEEEIQSLAGRPDLRSRGMLLRDPITGRPIVILASIGPELASVYFTPERRMLSPRSSLDARPNARRALGSALLRAPSNGVVEGNFQVNPDIGSTAQNEPSVAINPANPNNLVAGANDFKRLIVTPRGSLLADMGYYASQDGGRTWTGGFITRPSDFKGGSDPAIVADSQGFFYYALVAFSDNPTFDNGVLVAKSANGGRTFASPVPVVQHLRQANAPQEDKEYIAVDQTASRFRGNLYVSWTTFSFDSGQSLAIRLSRSTDGARTFAPALDLQSGAGLQGSVPSVGPNGEVYVAWQRFNQQLIRRSVDGGLSFDPLRTIAFAQPIGTIDPLSRRRVLNGGFRVNNFPSIAVDASSGPNTGNVYATYADGRNGDTDVFFTRSTDGGSTWSSPLRLNDDPPGNGRDQWFPWVAVDAANGDVYVGFYDRRDDPDNLLLNVYMARSTDGGQTFEPNLRITNLSSDSGFDPIFGGSFVGDYIGLAAHDRIAYPVWTDFRRKNADIFGAIVSFK